MKILQVIPSLSARFGGPSNAVLGLSASLARQGAEVNVYTTGESFGQRDVDGVKVFSFPLSFPGRYKFSLSLFKALDRDIPFFDIAHIHSCFQFSTQAACGLCRKYNKPYILRPLGQLDPFLLRKNSLSKSIYLSLFDMKNLRYAFCLHLTSQLERDWLKGLLKEDNGVVIPLGINLKEYDNLPAYGRFRWKYRELKDKKIILFLGRLNFKKGLDVLAESFLILSKKSDDLHLVIAGPDEGYGEKIKKYFNKNGLSKKVTFTGMLEGEEKLSAFKDSDVFVLPSYSENFGISALEAMAAGLPVVVSNKVGLAADIKAANAGKVIEVNNASLAWEIDFLLKEEQARKDIIANAAVLVREKYDWDKIGSQVLELYKKIIKERKCA